MPQYSKSLTYHGNCTLCRTEFLHERNRYQPLLVVFCRLHSTSDLDGLAPTCLSERRLEKMRCGAVKLAVTDSG